MLRCAAAFRAQAAAAGASQIAASSAAAIALRAPCHGEASSVQLIRSFSSLNSQSFLTYPRTLLQQLLAPLFLQSPSRSFHSSLRPGAKAPAATKKQQPKAQKKPAAKRSQTAKPANADAALAVAEDEDEDEEDADERSNARSSSAVRRRRGSSPLPQAPSAVGLTPSQLRPPQIHLTDALSLRGSQGGLEVSSGATDEAEDAEEQRERERAAAAADQEEIESTGAPAARPKRARLPRRAPPPQTTPRNWNAEVSSRLTLLFARLMPVRGAAAAAAKAAASVAPAPSASGKRRRRARVARPRPVPTEKKPVPLSVWNTPLHTGLQLLGNMGLVEQRCREELCALEMHALLRRFERGVLERQRFETRPQHQSLTADSDAAVAAPSAPKPHTPPPSPWMYFTLDDWRELAAREREEMERMQQQQQGQEQMSSSSAESEEPLFPLPNTPFDLPSAIAAHRRAAASSSLPSSFASPGVASEWPLLFLATEPYLLHHHRTRLVDAMGQRALVARVVQQEQERQLIFRPNPPPEDIAKRSAQYQAAHAAASPSLELFGHTEIRIDRLLDQLEREELRLAMLASSFLLLLETEARLLAPQQIEPAIRQFEEEHSKQLSEAARAQVLKLLRQQERREVAAAAREAARAAEIRARVYVSQSGVVHASSAQRKVEARKAAEEQRRILAMQPVSTDVTAAISSSSSETDSAAEQPPAGGGDQAASPPPPPPKQKKTEAELIAEAIAAAAVPSFLPLPESSPAPADEPALFSLFTVLGEPLGLPRRAQMIEAMSAETRHKRSRLLHPQAPESHRTMILRPAPASVGPDRFLMANVRVTLLDSVFRLAMAEEGVREYLRQIAEQTGDSTSFDRSIEERRQWIEAHPAEYAAERAAQKEATAELKHTAPEPELEPAPEEQEEKEEKDEKAQKGDQSAPSQSEASKKPSLPSSRSAATSSSFFAASTHELELYMRAMPTHAADCFLRFGQRDTLPTLTRMLLPPPDITRLTVELREAISDSAREELSQSLMRAGQSQWSGERGGESFRTWPHTVTKMLCEHALQLKGQDSTDEEVRALTGESAASRSAEELEQEQALLRREQTLFFEQHVSKFNPALRARVEAAAAAAATGDTNSSPVDRYPFSYLQRASQFRCGDVALPRVLSRLLFPLAALHDPSPHVIRVLPLSLWELWRQMCLSFYLRLRPGAFAPWRVPQSELPPEERLSADAIAALRGHRLPHDQVAHAGTMRLGDLVFVDTIDAQGRVVAAAAAPESSEAAAPPAAATAAIVEVVPSVLRNLPARVSRGRPKTAVTSPTVLSRKAAVLSRPKAPVRPEGLVEESRAGFEYFRALHNHKVQARETRLLRGLQRMGIEAEAKERALQEAERSLEAHAGGTSLFTPASVETMRSALSSLRSRISAAQSALPIMHAEQSKVWTDFVADWEQRHKEWQWRLSRQIGPFVAEAVHREFEALSAGRKRGISLAAVKKLQQQQQESASTGTVLATVPEDAASSSVAVTAASTAVASSLMPLSLPRVYNLLQTVAAVPDLMTELAHLPAVEDQLSDTISVDKLQRRLAEMRKPRPNVNVFPIESKESATAATATTSSSSSAALVPAASSTAPAVLSTAPAFLIVMTDLTTEQLKLIREGIVELCARRGISSRHLVSDRHAGVVHPLTSSWRSVTAGESPSLYADAPLSVTDASPSSLPSSSTSFPPLESASFDDHDDPWLVMQLGPIELHAFSAAESFSSIDALSKQHGTALQLRPALTHETLLGHSVAPTPNPLKSIAVTKLNIIAKHG